MEREEMVNLIAGKGLGSAEASPPVERAPVPRPAMAAASS
jgi:hypothetical protein